MGQCDFLRKGIYRGGGGFEMYISLRNTAKVLFSHEVMGKVNKICCVFNSPSDFLKL